MIFGASDGVISAFAGCGEVPRFVVSQDLAGYKCSAEVDAVFTWGG